MPPRFARAAAPVLAALVAACAASGPAATPTLREVALGNAGFEQEAAAGATCAPHWGCTAHSDVRSFRYAVDGANPASGRSSLRIERVGNEPWALVTQAIRDRSLRGARVRFSIAVRTEELGGNGAGPFVLAQGAAGATIAHRQQLTQGTSGWTRREIEFVVPEATEMLEVGAVLEGPGRLWIDDARLEVLESGKFAKSPL